MAAKTFDDWWSVCGKYYKCFDYEAKDIWNAAIESVEGVQNQTNNKQSTPCSCNAGVEYVPDSIRLCSKCGMPK